jgi:hypothetical protein
MPAPSDTYTAVAEFYAGEPLALTDVTGLTFMAVNLADDVALYGPSASDIEHQSVGTYAFDFLIPAGATPGGRVLLYWDSDQGSAQEIIDISAPPSPTSPTVDAPCMDGDSGQQWNPDTSVVTKWSDFPPAIQTFAKAMAAQVLWTALGRRYNLCDIVVRPCLQQRLPTYLTFPSIWNPGAEGGQWAWGLIGGPDGSELIFGGCGCTSGVCGCRRRAVPIPGPVSSIVSVTIGSETLAPTAYRLYGNELIRQDGHAWPHRQDYSTPLGEDHTWSVRYLRGVPVPPMANMVAGFYAGEIAKLLAGQACSLPQRLQSVTRQGVSAKMLSSDDYLDKGRTGVPLVDQYIVSQNPYGLAEAPRVHSLDMPTYG